MGFDAYSFVETYQKAIVAIAFILILFGTVVPILSGVVFICLCAVLMIGNDEVSLSLLMFLVSCANIFKMSASSQSFYTFLCLVFSVQILIKNRVFPARLIVFSFLIIFVQILTNTVDVTKTIKLLSSVLLLYAVKEAGLEKFFKKFALFYVIGVISASLIKLANLSVFQVNKYIVNKALGDGLGYVDMNRFSAMYEDPNYYSVNLILGLCIIVLLYYKNELNAIFSLFLSSFLVYFVILTYSKSSMLMLALPVAVLLYSSKLKKQYSVYILFAIAIGVVVVLAFAGKLPFIDIMIARFKNSSGESKVDSLTSGRSEIWKGYIEYFSSNLWFFFIGSGIGKGFVNSMAAHNTFIEMLYFIGCIGSAVLISIIREVSEFDADDKKNLMNYCGFICIIVMYFFLSELFYFDAVIHIAFASMIYRRDYTSEIVNKEKYKISIDNNK